MTGTPQQSETICSWRNWLRWYLLLIVVFAFDVGVRELRPSEAVLHTVAAEMVRSGDYVHPKVHGQPVDVEPFCAWFIAATSRVTVSDWAVRMPSVLAVAAMGLVCAWIASRAQGRRAGMVAGIVPLTTVAGLRFGTVASNDVLFALALGLAWFSWFRLGRSKRRWGLAWSVALAFVFVGVLAGGLGAFVYFYLPLFFLRKPVRIWRRMLVPGHIVTLAAVGVLSGIWVAHVHGGETLTVLHPFARTAASGGLRGVLIRLLTLPFSGALLLFPWVFLAWPAFCVAFRPVEKPAVLCQYLRTVVLALFVPCWLVPGISVGALLPLLCPVAVLTGLHYDILMRRYGRRLEALVRLFRRLGFLIAGVGTGVAVLHASGALAVEGLPVSVSCMSIVLFLGAVLALYQAGLVEGRAFWFRLTIATAAAKFGWSAITVPVGFVTHADARKGAAVLARDVPEQATIHRLTPRPLVRVCRYLGRPVVRIETPSQIPAGDSPVFVLGREKAPIEEDRVWEPCSAPVPIDARRRVDWGWRPEDGGLVGLGFRESGVEGERPTRWIRVYRGEPREAAPVSVEGIDVDTILPEPEPVPEPEPELAPEAGEKPDGGEPADE